jgi:hypothetical protein
MVNLQLPSLGSSMARVKITIANRRGAAKIFLKIFPGGFQA